MENKEKPISYEQTPEEIRRIFIEAADETKDIDKRPRLDLVILALDGTPHLSIPLIVEEIQGDVAYVTYLNENDETMELIPLELSRVKKAEIRK